MRRKNDAYYTPTWATEALLKKNYINIHPVEQVFEPCVGDGAISEVLQKHVEKPVLTNDIDFGVSAHYHSDAADPEFWISIPDKHGNDISVDWVITNPPFSVAFPIVKNAYSKAKVGCAFLLRLSFLEPTYDRGEWLDRHPPQRLLVLPRISFTGDGKTDSVTCAWMIWLKPRDGFINIGTIGVMPKND